MFSYTQSYQKVTVLKSYNNNRLKLTGGEKNIMFYKVVHVLYDNVRAMRNILKVYGNHGLVNQ